MRNKLVLVLTTLLMMLSSAYAQDTPNSRQARRIFDQAYNQVFGPEGATLRYDVNIIGIYKTNGTIWFKGKKRKFEDKHSRKFQFDPENFEYGVSEESDGLKITLKAKKGVKGIKEAHVLVTHKTYYPISVRIKLAFIWTTIKISDFQAGGIPDEMFRFPQEKFKNYKIVDKR